jgi:hypothetical protein
MGFGLGTLIGGVVGGIPGAIIGSSDKAKEYLFGGSATKGIDAKPANYDRATAQLGQIADAAGSRAAPTIGGAQLAMGPQGEARGGLMGVANRLGSVATGETSGAGEMAVNRQVGQATAAQQALARTARGPAAALAMRNAARNTMDIGFAGAGQAAEAQRADQAAANAQLGQVYGAMRSGDIDVASQNAQLGQQAQIENMRAQLAQTGMNDAQQMQAIGQMLGWDQATINAQLQRAAIDAGDKGMLPGLLQVGGQIGAAYATGGLSSAAPKAMTSSAPMARPRGYLSGSSDLMDPRYA